MALAMVTERSGRTLGLRSAMLDEHLELEGIFGFLLRSCRANAREDAAAAWIELDERIQRHFKFEERVLFPRFAKVDPLKVERLLEVHAQVRRLVAQMGAEVDLHLLRLSNVDDFVELMRRHAHRENELLYRLAEQNLERSRQRKAARPLKSAPYASTLSSLERLR